MGRGTNLRWYRTLLWATTGSCSTLDLEKQGKEGTAEIVGELLGKGYMTRLEDRHSPPHSPAHPAKDPSIGQNQKPEGKGVDVVHIGQSPRAQGEMD